MDEHLTSAVSRAVEKEELPEGAVDEDDDEASSMDIEHEQIYYLLADAYPDQFDGPEDARDQIHDAFGVEDEEKGVDDEEDREEEAEDFNPGNTPDNLDQHPYDEEEWQEDYDAEYEEKECGHTDHRGRPLDGEECPWCGEDDD